jgi:FkbM family methyltransferase
LKKFIVSLAGFLARCMPASWKRALYRSPRLARFLRRMLNRAVPQGRTVVKVQAGGLQGASLELDLHNEKDYWLGTYEMDLQAAIRRLIEPGSTVYDVGANVGYISLLLALQVGSQGQVIAIEALPLNVQRLQRNIELNAFAANIVPIQAAVVDKQSKVRFLVHASASMGKAAGSAGREEAYKDEIEVNGISLDNFIFQQHHPRPDAIKMDIEGGEVLAMQGMPRLLEEIRPLLLIELHGGEAAKAVYNTLQQHGYALHSLSAYPAPIHSVQELDWKLYVAGIPPGK